MKKKSFYSIALTLAILFTFTGCAEHRYYQQNHRHTDEYEHRHHSERSLDIDVHK